MKVYYVYILTNKKQTVLYVGVTNDLMRRKWEHKSKLVDGFTKKYNLNRLVYFEEYSDINKAIYREKRLKRWNKSYKQQLINKVNLKWSDLYSEFL